MEESVRKFIKFLEAYIVENSIKIGKESDEIAYEKLSIARMIIAGMIIAGMSTDSIEVTIEDAKNPEHLKNMLEYINQCEFICKILKIKINHETDEDGLFCRFDIISDLFKLSNLSVKDQLNIIYFLLRKNMMLGIMNPNRKFYDFTGVINYEFNTISRDEVENMINNNTIYEFCNGNLGLFKFRSLKQKQEILDFISKCEIDITRESKLHREIFNSYFCKIDTFDSDDIDNIINAFISLGVDNEICEKFKYILTKDLNKRLKSEQNSTVVTEIYKQKSSETISNNEYNLVERELKSYFDFKNMKLLRPLSINERIYVLSLLKKLKYDEDTIYKFLKISEIEMNMKNPIALYNELYEKLKYYEEKYGLSNELQELEQYFSEIFISDNDDYEFWKSCIEKNLNSVLKLIPRTYEYEFSKASNING